MFFDRLDISRLLPANGGLHTSLLLIESGAMRRMDECLAMANAKHPITAVYDTNTYAATEGRHPTTDREIVLPAEGLHADESAVGLLLDELAADTGTIIAVGAGTIHDISRFCAHKRGIEFISCPTAASVDGFCSNVAAMTWQGSKKTVEAVAPLAVVADTDIITAAPERLAKSGVGDILGKYTALADWKIAHILTGERYDEAIANAMKTAVDIVVDCSEGILSKDAKAHESLCYALLLSGLAMQAFGNSRPASGAEHHISHLIEMSPSPLHLHSTASHGEKVGVGTLIVAARYHDFAQRLTDGTEYEYEALTKDAVERLFGELTDAVMLENSCACDSGLTAKLICANRYAVCDIIDEIPKHQEIKALFDRLGLLGSLPEIGVDADKEDLIFTVSPLVRNRLTLARVIRGVC